MEKKEVKYWSIWKCDMFYPSKIVKSKKKPIRKKYKVKELTKEDYDWYRSLDRFKR